jgi:hypothetical protein
MSVIRRAQEQSFTVLPNSTIRDHRLSLDALGLLVKLISRPPNWEVRPHQLQKECSIGRDRLRRILAELEDSGYLVRQKCRKPDGTWDWISEVYQEAQTQSNEQQGTNTIDGFSGDGATMSGFSVDGLPDDGLTTDGQDGDLKRTVLNKTEQKKQIGKKQRVNSLQNFVVSESMNQWALINTPGLDVTSETEKFIDKSIENSCSFKDSEAALAAWRNWMRRGYEYLREQLKKQQPARPVPKFVELPNFKRGDPDVARKHLAEIKATISNKSAPGQ